MATKQYIYSSSNITNDKLIAGTGGLTVQEVTVGSGLTLTAGTLTASNLIPLTTTIADAENTTSEIDVLTVTVPANTLAVGDVIDIIIDFQRYQNSGVTRTVASRLTINGTNIYNQTGLNLSSINFTYYIIQKQSLVVESISGSNIKLRAIFNTGQSSVGGTISFSSNANSNNDGGVVADQSLSSIDNTSNISIVYKLQWGSANVNAWFRFQQAQAYIIKKAV